MSGDKLKGLSLFSGNGGIDLALRDYVETIGYCEIDRYSQHLIASNIEKGYLDFAPIYPDVTRLRGKRGDCEIIFGGFPCTDISVAGLGKGLEGKRSGLFFEVVRLVQEVRPTFVFLENVPAIRTRGLAKVVETFTEMGYDCRWTCLSAASVGAPHKRERWFFLAYSNSNSNWGQERESLAVQEAMESIIRQNDSPTRQFGRASTDEWGCSMYGYDEADKKDVADSNSLWEQSKQDSRELPSDWIADSSWWETQSSVGRVANELPFRMDRIKSCGNGVVPVQVKKAFETLMGISRE